MKEDRLITEAMMPLLARFRTSPKFIFRIVGEMIIADALINTRERGADAAKTLEDALQVLRVYEEELVPKAASAVSEYLVGADAEVLVASLQEINQELSKLLALTSKTV